MCASVMTCFSRFRQRLTSIFIIIVSCIVLYLCMPLNIVVIKAFAQSLRHICNSHQKLAALISSTKRFKKRNTSDSMQPTR